MYLKVYISLAETDSTDFLHLVFKQDQVSVDQKLSKQKAIVRLNVHLEFLNILEKTRGGVRSSQETTWNKLLKVGRKPIYGQN